MDIGKNSIALLAADPENPREITDQAAHGLGVSLYQFGDLSFVFNCRTGQMVSGHQRLDQLRAAGATEFTAMEPPYPGTDVGRAYIDHPATGERFFLRIVDWDPERQRFANVTANNQQIAGHFTDALPALLERVEAAFPREWAEMSMDDLMAEIAGAAAVEPPSEPAPTPDDEPPPDEPTGPPDSVQGEVYQLGPHRLVCGDCRDFGAWQKLLTDGERVNLVFTSPPYASQRKYDESSGFRPIPPDEYGAWWEDVQANVRANLADDGSFFVNIKPHSDGLDVSLYVLDLVSAMVKKWGWHFASEFCWPRAGVPGKPARRFKNQHEPVYQFSLGPWKFRPENVRHASDDVPRYSRNNRLAAGLNKVAGQNSREWVIDTGEGLAYPGTMLQMYGYGGDLGHTAAFPVGLPDFFVRAYTDPGDLVCDVFMGSGSTMIAAAQNGRRSVGFEISPRYCDMIRRRWARWAVEHGQDPGAGALPDA